jgi:hypothetical protein
MFTKKLGIFYRTKGNHIIVSTVRTKKSVIMKLLRFTGTDDDWDYGRSKCYPFESEFLPERFEIVERLGTKEECPHVFL